MPDSARERGRKPQENKKSFGGHNSLPKGQARYRREDERFSHGTSQTMRNTYFHSILLSFRNQYGTPHQQSFKKQQQHQQSQQYPRSKAWQGKKHWKYVEEK